MWRAKITLKHQLYQVLIYIMRRASRNLCAFAVIVVLWWIINYKLHALARESSRCTVFTGATGADKRASTLDLQEKVHIDARGDSRVAWAGPVQAFHRFHFRGSALVNILRTATEEGEIDIIFVPHFPIDALNQLFAG
ncbi:hypothetical protein CPB86DRAFT_302041 [Serendipita vermifera]|nr:hypothetical protein CPB86DRAFT_302041 [Serendipita vermifera]